MWENLGQLLFVVITLPPCNSDIIVKTGTYQRRNDNIFAHFVCVCLCACVCVSFCLCVWVDGGCNVYHKMDVKNVIKVPISIALIVWHVERVWNCMPVWSFWKGGAKRKLKKKEGLHFPVWMQKKKGKKGIFTSKWGCAHPPPPPPPFPRWPESMPKTGERRGTLTLVSLFPPSAHQPLWQANK